MIQIIEALKLFSAICCCGGEDRNGLDLEKGASTFSSFDAKPAQTAKKKLWSVLPDDICLEYFAYE